MSASNQYLDRRLSEIRWASRHMGKKVAMSDIESAWLWAIIRKVYDKVNDNDKDIILAILHKELKDAGYLGEYGQYKEPI